MRTWPILPWLLAGAILVSLYVGQARTSAARDEAMQERGRNVELVRQRAAAEEEALEARRIATARGDSAEMARQEARRIRAEAAQEAAESRRAAIAAGRTHTEAADRLRATLTAAGLPTADVDTMQAASVRKDEAHAAEVAAIAADRDGQEARAVGAESYAEAMVAALDRADDRSAALEAERDSYRRQAEAWARVAQPGILRRIATEVGRAAVYGGAGYVAGRLAP